MTVATAEKTCHTTGCTNTRKYADVCSTCKSREVRGSTPTQEKITLPADPLLAFAADRDVTISDLEPGSTLSLRRADFLACKEFFVHPSVIWGAAYWDATAA